MKAKRGVVLISNRRMIRDEEARQQAAKRQETFRNNHKTQDEAPNSNGNVTGDVTGENGESNASVTPCFICSCICTFSFNCKYKYPDNS